MKKLNERGFGAVEALLIIVALGIVIGTIFYVRKANNNVGNGNNGTTINQGKNKHETNPQSQLETYTFDKTGLSFKYPKAYKLDDFGADNDPNTLPGLVFVSKISDSEISNASNRDSFDKYLKLSINESENDPDPVFAKKEKLFPGEQKIIDTVTINGKQYSLVSGTYNGSVVSVTLMDCDSSDQCTDRVAINDKYFTQAAIGSVANTQSYAIPINTSSSEYQTFIDMLKSISF
ncbi:MAG TPA: hypothetical protein VFW77_04080 [Candidatus Saccharimonadales bacterium]|nr:hypothetical protein [Candidatus Saccharimonadales bacterium]